MPSKQNLKYATATVFYQFSMLEMKYGLFGVPVDNTYIPAEYEFIK